MLPDLGKYEVAVLSAYGAAIVLIVVLVVWTLIRGAKVRRQLDEVEKRRGRKNG
ncbi:heme exporter protein CcmD [Acidimangrovimonas pyrenivorans]|uniref:Heme exporter protein D n=1 Tax=Acidimangrovimonas pyrenivorans TaxID=2030798 RepID=A0ABV7AIV0_9RHOB